MFFRTGWGKHWSKDNAKFNGGEPGHRHGSGASGCPTRCRPASSAPTPGPPKRCPNPDAGCAFCVHAHLLTRHGIVNQENMDLDALATDKAWRFLYVYSPMPIVGATGSVGSPVAVR